MYNERTGTRSLSLGLERGEFSIYNVENMLMNASKGLVMSF